MAPSTPPPRPHVDYIEQPLAVGDRVAFVATEAPGLKPRLFTGRIVVIHDEQVCVESGDLTVLTGAYEAARGNRPTRIYHAGLYRLPEEQQGGDDR